MAELVASELDPEGRVRLYLAEKHLGEAEGLYARGNLPQAGEKCRGAVTSLLNATAERRGGSTTPTGTTAWLWAGFTGRLRTGSY